MCTQTPYLMICNSPSHIPVDNACKHLVREEDGTYDDLPYTHPSLTLTTSGVITLKRTTPLLGGSPLSSL